MLSPLSPSTRVLFIELSSFVLTPIPWVFEPKVAVPEVEKAPMISPTPSMWVLAVLLPVFTMVTLPAPPFWLLLELLVPLPKSNTAASTNAAESTNRMRGGFFIFN